MIVDHDEMVVGGEELRIGDQVVGVINSPAYSHRLGQSLALAHVAPAANRPDAQITVVGEGTTYAATLASVPFHDPEKTRTHAE